MVVTCVVTKVWVCLQDPTPRSKTKKHDSYDSFKETLFDTMLRKQHTQNEYAQVRTHPCRVDNRKLDNVSFLMCSQKKCPRRSAIEHLLRLLTLHLHHMILIHDYVVVFAALHLDVLVRSSWPKVFVLRLIVIR